MSNNPTPFQIAIQPGGLKSRPKDATAETERLADQAGEQHGFVDRGTTRRRGGRAPSPRTGQVHAKVLPAVADEIAQEATRRGVTQGVVIEEAWTLYLRDKAGK